VVRRSHASEAARLVGAGIELPAEVAGLVVLDELVVHGWHIAVATGQPYKPSVLDVEAASSFVESFDAPRDGNLRPGSAGQRHRPAARQTAVGFG